MKAISLWQPWATLWLLSDPDEKLFETRHWYTAYRGKLLVHAAKKRDGDVRAALADPFVRERLALHGLAPEDLPFGALIGTVHLVGCCGTGTVLSQRSIPEREEHFGNWAMGRYAWERGARPVRYQKPIPYAGHQGFFDVPYSVLAEVA